MPKGASEADDQEGLPAPGPQAPSRRQSGRQGRPEALPGGPGGLRGPEGRGQAAGLRPVRPRRARGGFRPPVSGGRLPGRFSGFGGPGAAGAPFEGIHFETGDLGGPLRQPLRRAPRDRARSRARTSRGQIEVPFRDAVLGGTASLALRREKRVPDLRGHRDAPARRVCPTCRGEGVVAESERVRIKIPEGTEDGGTIRVPGKGAPGARGGPIGDLYVTVRVTPHPVLRAPRQRHPRRRSDHGQGGVRRRRDRSAHDPRHGHRADSARHAGTAAVPSARQGRRRIRARAEPATTSTACA